MPKVRTQQDETLDSLCYRVLGRTGSVTEQALELNPGLAELGPLLPQGLLVTLPDERQAAPLHADTLQLWR
ncbi:tail protein X [Halomonas sp. DP5N14-9]|uniref:tail protein X n=1 Tax=Halomonas sp. DP5N14-9 TaxID=2859075 RepID=UPI001C9A172B|nr:tail protein X [Halomonas sp. DP5N14-9]MBY5940381.1 tail protein X [Halomonas sp. DP5N14-9]